MCTGGSYPGSLLPQLPWVGQSVQPQTGLGAPAGPATALGRGPGVLQPDGVLLVSSWLLRAAVLLGVLGEGVGTGKRDRTCGRQTAEVPPTPGCWTFLWKRYLNPCVLRLPGAYFHLLGGQSRQAQRGHLCCGLQGGGSGLVVTPISKISS